MSAACSHSRTQVYSYIDGEMRWFSRIRIWWHLRRCPPCADGFVFERKFLDKVRRDCVDDVPQELIDRLRAFLDQHGPEPSGASPTSEE